MSIAEMLVPDLHRRAARVTARAPRPEAATETEATGWTATWDAWGTTASVTVTEPDALPAARRLVGRQFAATEKAAARFRTDAELHKLYRAGGRTVTVSLLLADLVAAALAAAERTDGDVDPTVSAAMNAVHGRRQRGRDRTAIPVCSSTPSADRAVPGWQQVELRGRRLRVPAGTTLDLSATATAVACDRAAAQVRERLGVGVLVTLGGDAASAGPAPDGGWPVVLNDRTGDRGAEVRLPAGAALSTSHFSGRPRSGDGSTGRPGGHLIDPHTGQVPAAVWRMATAVGFTSLEASTYTAATLVRGLPARAWLTQLWVPARLVTVYDDVINVGPWSTPPFPTPPPANPRRTTR